MQSERLGLEDVGQNGDAGDHDHDRIAWRLAVDAAGVGAFEWNLTTGDLRWDRRLLELFGIGDAEFGGTIEAFNALVHHEDLPRVSNALSAAIDTCGHYEAEYRIVRPGGEVRWVSARGRALADRPGGPAARVLGAAYDTTAARGGRCPGRPGPGVDAVRVLPARHGVALQLRELRGRAAPRDVPRRPRRRLHLGAVPRRGRERLRDQLPARGRLG